MNVENLDQQKERKLQTGYDNFELVQLFINRILIEYYLEI